MRALLPGPVGDFERDGLPRNGQPCREDADLITLSKVRFGQRCEQWWRRDKVSNLGVKTEGHYTL
jgi:hypothetical protein